MGMTDIYHELEVVSVPFREKSFGKGGRGFIDFQMRELSIVRALVAQNDKTSVNIGKVVQQQEPTVE